MTVSPTAFAARLLLLMLLIAALYIARDLLIPLAIAGVLATLLAPVCNWLERHRLPRWLAVTLPLAALVAAMGGIGLVLGWQFAAFSGDLPQIEQTLFGLWGQAQQWASQSLGIGIEAQGDWLKGQHAILTDAASGVIGSMTSLLSGAVFAAVYLLLFLFYRHHLQAFMLRLFAPADRADAARLIGETVSVSQRYLAGLMQMIVLLWLMYGLAFSALGLRNALFFAVLCGVLEVVPYVGNLVGTSLALVAALAQGASPPMLGGIVASYLLIQFVQGWLLEPLIVGRHVRLNPLATILALVIGESLWGIAGVFLAIPATAMLKVVFDHIESLQAWGFLLGEPQGSEPERLSLVKRWKAWLKSR